MAATRREGKNERTTRVPNETRGCEMPQHPAELERRIRERAYEIWVARGRQSGTAEEDWRLAEEEVLGITGGG